MVKGQKKRPIKNKILSPFSRRELKQKAVDYKGGKCEACGYNRCLQALTFHHRNPSEKDFGISDIINIVSWKDLEKELQKTHLLCNNCHVEAHHGILDGYIDSSN